MIKRFFSFSIALVFALTLVSVASADDKATLTGHIVDKACSARVAKKEDPQAAAMGHGKGCALSENCAKSGFGVFADGKFVEFDEKGNTMAKAALEKTGKDKGAKFKVTGKMAEGKITVESISEVE
jgi:hypothetical protein